MVVVVVVDVNFSDYLVCSLGHQMSIVSLISLGSPFSIGQDKVEINSLTIFVAVFKTRDPEVFSLLNGLS